MIASKSHNIEALNRHNVNANIIDNVKSIKNLTFQYSSF